ncbi:phasin family protein [Enterovirga sp.]|uniref:phasin family protein n=1 Tax=Enterovirga sp. TaxID=2026350 RepID=UPI002604A352|nr:phasin family protein [Enterovirga sp.]MDB5590491.1 Phasin [Enterovirga sp.]
MLGNQMINFDHVQTLTRDGVEATVKSFGALSTGAQAAATQAADYARHSFEQGSQVAERLMGVRTLEAAVQVQSDYFKTAYENLVTQASKMGEIASSTAKDTFAPVEGFAARSLKAS